MNIELKLCPFCGNEAHVIFIEHRDMPCVAVQCSHCLARSDVALLSIEYDVETAISTAAEFWGQRV